MRLAALPLALLLIANNDPDSIPDNVKVMLDAAMASGSESDVRAVTKYAVLATPESASAIRELVNKWSAARADAADRVIRTASFGELLKGKIELGGFLTTGNTDNIGVNAVVDLKREGLVWRHKFRLAADYQESRGIVSRERLVVAYEPNFKMNDRLYGYGSAQFEADRFLGVETRYALSTGAGYAAINSGPMSLDLEVGPALRRTSFTDNRTQTEFGARGSIDFDWKLSRALTFSQDASAYLQNLNSTLVSKTALAAKVYGPLSAQMSYAVTHESRPPVGRANTDTTSRASLVYTF